MTQNVTVTANFTSSGGGSGNACVGGRFTDARDGQEYGCVTIGTQVWMAQNLNYAGSGGNVGVCYDNQESNCDIYGRLYNWAAVMGFESICDSTFCVSQVQTRHQGICPAGWHVPSDAEWTTLINFVGGASTAGTRLKSESGGWRDWDGRDANGTNNFGFSALPGGTRTNLGFTGIGRYGDWWSTTEDDVVLRVWYVRIDGSAVMRVRGFKSLPSSLRCVRYD
jgi:uncharacterized protein (TIGR02145 family)